MEWVRISEAVALSQRPARTIRHNALIGKIRAKKEGKDWLVDLNSLREIGWLPKDGSLPLFPPDLPPIQSTGDTTFTAANFNPERRSRSKEKSGRPFRDVKSLGVYAELLEFCRSEVFKKIQFEDIGEFMVKALVQLSIGYFEFDNKNKLVSYRSARHNLLHSLVHLHLKETEEPSDIKATLELINKVVPGIGGLIRRTEKRMYERRPRPESSIQD